MPFPSLRTLVRFVATITLTLAAPAFAQRNLAGFMPPPPEGWQGGEVHVREDLNGMEPAASRAYAPAKLGAKGGLFITLTRPSPADLASYFADRTTGPSPFVPEMMTTRVKVDSVDAWLTWNQRTGGGMIEMKVGRVQVGIQGSEVSREQALAFARSIDIPRLLKY